MEINEQIKLRFTGVDFPSISLNSMKSHFDSETYPIKVSIDPKVFLPKDKKNYFDILMSVDISAKDHFELNVVAIGHFQLSKEDVSDEERKTFVNANSPAIMFPYVRAFISTLTGNLGDVMNCILLPTRFFKGNLEELEGLEDSPPIIKEVKELKQ